MLAESVNAPRPRSIFLTVTIHSARFSSHLPSHSYFIEARLSTPPRNDHPNSQPDSSQNYYRTEVVKTPTPSFIYGGPFRFPLPPLEKHHSFFHHREDAEVVLTAIRIEPLPYVEGDEELRWDRVALGEGRVKVDEKLIKAIREREGRGVRVAVEFLGKKGRKGVGLPAGARVSFEIVEEEVGGSSPEPIADLRGAARNGSAKEDRKERGVEQQPLPAKPQKSPPVTSMKDNNGRRTVLDASSSPPPSHNDHPTKATRSRTPASLHPFEARPIEPPADPAPIRKKAKDNQPSAIPKDATATKKEVNRTSPHRLRVDIHDAWDMPSIKNPSTGEVAPPSPYVTASVGADTPLASTNIAASSRQAVFEETLTLDIPVPYTSSNPIHPLTLSLYDSQTSTPIQQFHIPISPTHFLSLRQTTLVLVGHACKLRISITNLDDTKKDIDALMIEYDGAMLGLEVNPRELAGDVGMVGRVCLAVRVVENVGTWKEGIERWRRRAGLGLKSSHASLSPHAELHFNPEGEITDSAEMDKKLIVPHSVHATSKHSARWEHQKNAYYQMMVAANADRPVWNESLRFCFSPSHISKTSGLSIELYRIHPPIDTSPSERQIDDLIAYGTIPIRDITSKAEDRAVQMTFVGDYEDRKGDILVGLKPSSDWSQTIRNLPEKQHTTAIKQIQPAVLPDFDLQSAIERDESAPAAEPSISIPSASVLRRDIEQRQQFVDRLLGELEVRTEAVKKVGEDLYRLREAYSDLEKQNETLKTRLSASEIKTEKLMNLVEIDVLSHDELKKRYAMLAERLRLEKGSNESLSKRLEEVQEGVIQRNDMEMKFLQLQHAHTAQQAVVQKLQEDLSQSLKLKPTIEKQETIIRKLEELLKDAVGNNKGLEAFFSTIHNNPGDIDIAIQRMMAEENALLRERVLQLEIGRRGKGEEVQDRNDHTRRHDATDHPRQKERRQEDMTTEEKAEYFRAVMRAERAEARVKALEEELTESAKQFAKKLVDLKLQKAVQNPPSPLSNFPLRDVPPKSHLSSKRRVTSRSSIRLDPLDGTVSV